MALLRGKLLAGALFSGLLFGPHQVEEQVIGGGYNQVSWFLQYEAKRAEYLRAKPTEKVEVLAPVSREAQEIAPEQPAIIAVSYKPIKTSPPISKEDIASIMKDARLEAERMEEELIVALLMEFMA